MIAIYIVFSFAVGVYLGVKIYKLMVENEINKENEKLITNINNQFNFHEIPKQKSDLIIF